MIDMNESTRHRRVFQSYFSHSFSYSLKYYYCSILYNSCYIMLVFRFQFIRYFTTIVSLSCGGWSAAIYLRADIQLIHCTYFVLVS